jgi:hypothetical protein
MYPELPRSVCPWVRKKVPGGTPTPLNPGPGRRERDWSEPRGYGILKRSRGAATEFSATLDTRFIGKGAS